MLPGSSIRKMKARLFFFKLSFVDDCLISRKINNPCMVFANLMQSPTRFSKKLALSLHYSMSSNFRLSLYAITPNGIVENWKNLLFSMLTFGSQFFREDFCGSPRLASNHIGRARADLVCQEKTSWNVIYQNFCCSYCAVELQIY